MVYSVLWHGLGFISLAAVVELIRIAVRELQGSTVRDTALSVLMGVVCAVFALAVLFFALLYSEYTAWFLGAVHPAAQLLLCALVLSGTAFMVSFIVTRFFKNSFPRGAVRAVALLCSATAIFLPIGYDWLLAGLAFGERLLA